MYIVILSLSFPCAKFSESVREIGIPPENTPELHRPYLRPTVSFYEVIAPKPGKLFFALLLTPGLWIRPFAAAKNGRCLNCVAMAGKVQVLYAEPAPVKHVIPSDWNFSRFLNNVIDLEENHQLVFRDG